MLDYPFNWNWVLKVDSSGGRIKRVPMSTSYRASSLRGPNDANKLRSFQKEVQSDLASLTGIVNNTIRPVLNSLPAGGADSRWSLRSEIDCYSYGVQGSTLFVFNSANNTFADGRYWSSEENRPYTIAEKIEDHDGRISELESIANTDVVSSGSIDLQDLWRAVGANYQSGTKTSWTNSLDARVGRLECHDSQLAPDLYGDSRATTGGYTTPSNTIEKYEGYNSVSGDPGWGGWSWAGSCDKTQSFGVAEYVHYLALLHGIDVSSGEDPWKLDHDPSLGGSISLPLSQGPTDIRSSVFTTRSRTDPVSDSLLYDLGRVRYELERLRGTDWSTGNQTGPFISNWPGAGDNEQSLYLHINYTGSGTPSISNPHGVHYTETDADTQFNAVASFVGQNAIGDNTTNYSAHVGALSHIADGDSLELALAKVDSATPVSIQRYQMLVSRSSMTEEEREDTAIAVSHNLGQYPIVNVLDMDPEELNPYTASWTRDLNIEHINVNEFHIYTGAEDVLIVWIG